MTMTDVVRRICALDGGEQPWSRRRPALMALAAIVTGALAVNFAAGRVGGASLELANAIAQVCVPLLAAWPLRGLVGDRIFTLAAILVAGLAAPILYLGPAQWAAGVVPNSFAATGMVWVLGSNPRTPTAALVGSSTILALAFALAALI